jgi:hypothetical protein
VKRYGARFSGHQAFISHRSFEIGPRLVDEVIDSTSASMKRLRSLGDAKSTTSTEEGDHFSFSVYPGSAARVIVMANSIPVKCGNMTVIRKDGCDFCTACGAVGSCG